MERSQGGLQRKGGLGKDAPFLFNIYLIEMAEESERAQLGVKLEGCWCGALMCADDVVLVADSGPELQAILDVVEAYVSRWKMKFNSRKSKVMVVGKREAGELEDW